MVSPLRPATSDAAIHLAQSQIWLQNALNALYYGADNPQATAMLRKAEEHLNAAEQAAKSIYSTSLQPTMRFGVRMDRGQRRRTGPNEDAFFATSGTLPLSPHLPFGLFIVADGMGGHTNGQMASNIVIQHIADHVIPGLLAGEGKIHGLLVDSIQQAHRAIVEYNWQSNIGMGSVVTVALIIGQTASIANVGDSRTYLHRPGYGLQQITRDHSTVASLVEAGEIQPEEIYTHPLRNEVYRALGVVDNIEVEIDLFTFELERGDKLLLCSDGIWEMVRDQEIERLLDMETEEPVRTAHALYEAAIKGGGLDNIGIVVVDYTIPTTQSDALLPSSSPQRDTLDLLDADEDDHPETQYLSSLFTGS